MRKKWLPIADTMTKLQDQEILKIGEILKIRNTGINLTMI